MRPVILVGAFILATTSSLWYATFGRPVAVVSAVRIGSYRITVRDAHAIALPRVPASPVGYDCNSALFWDDDTLYSFTSHEHPYRGSGNSLDTLGGLATRVEFDTDPTGKAGGRWIEAVHRRADGVLFMWYHLEPKGVVPRRAELTAPKIGQMCSLDNGLHWADQGIVLEAAPESFEIETANQYFIGGHGDFSVIPDRTGAYFYFLFSSYDRSAEHQGIAMARLAATDLHAPAGKVRKWYEGAWTEPGIGGRVSPVFPAESSWHAFGTKAFWGPSVHWNTHINSYVMLMNHAVDTGFGQSGVYVSLCEDLDDPRAWSRPARLLEASEWYPEVIGDDAGQKQTDRLAGRVARLFLKGKSAWEIEFERVSR